MLARIFGYMVFIDIMVVNALINMQSMKNTHRKFTSIQIGKAIWKASPSFFYPSLKIYNNISLKMNNANAQF